MEVSSWTTLEPTDMESAGGAALTLLEDGSILVSGANTVGDAYTVLAEGNAMRVTAFRLEALTDPSPPVRDPGRAPTKDRGNFYMTNWEVTAPEPNGAEVPVPLGQAIASPAPQVDWKITTTGWNITGNTSQPNTAIYLLEQPLAFQQRLKMKFQMQFFDSQEWPFQNLGRFRISVSDRPNAFHHSEARIVIEKSGDPWSKLVQAYAWSGDTAALNELLVNRPELAGIATDIQLETGQYEHAISGYDSIITPETQGANLLTRRAAAHVGLRHMTEARLDIAESIAKPKT